MFDKDIFIQALAERIAQEFRARAVEFKKHRLGAVAMFAAPWHKCILLSVLIETDERRKWDIADWEHYEFADLGDSDHSHTVANPAGGEEPGERGLPNRCYRPGRKSQQRHQGKRKRKG